MIAIILYNYLNLATPTLYIWYYLSVAMNAAFELISSIRTMDLLMGL